MSKEKRNAKGQGCFIENPDGTFLYRKSVGVKSDGKRKVLVARANTKAACIQIMKEKERDWENSKTLKTISKKETVATLCKKHLLFQIDNGELKPKSIDRREDTIKNQIEKYPLGKMQINAITAIDIDNHFSLLSESSLSNSSIEKALDVLNAAYNWAIARGELSINPVAQIKSTIQRRLANREVKTADDADVIVLSQEERDLFLEESLKKNKWNNNYKYYGGLYGRFLLHSGLRIGEFIGALWEDYDEENGLFRVDKNMVYAKNRDNNNEKKHISITGSTKNKKSRLIKLSPEAIEDLKLIKERFPGKAKEHICRTRTGKNYTATEMDHLMNTIFRNLGFDKEISGTHVFRHSFATEMHNQGADIKDIAAYIGDLESTASNYYVASRVKIRTKNDETQIIVPLPTNKKVPTKDEDSEH